MNKFTKGAVPIEFHLPATVGKHFDFENKYHNWIHNSTNKIKGLPEKRFLVNGITDAFHHTYIKYNKIGIFKGEYGYHHEANYTYNLQEADVIIVSHPFSADGMSATNKLLEADTYNKPIFVDCAFFGICGNINFDFSIYKNIMSVCFSLSKTFGTGMHRIGMLYTNDDYPLLTKMCNHYPIISQSVQHLPLLQKYNANDIFLKYRKKQLEICKENNLVPSDTVIFGLDYQNIHNDFTRHNVNRLCLSKLLVDK